MINIQPKMRPRLTEAGLTKRKLMDYDKELEGKLIPEKINV